MQKFKRFLAAILVAMTLLSCNVTGFALTKPSLSKTAAASPSWSVKRGGTIKFRFLVNSNNYPKKSGRYRSILASEVYNRNWNYLKGTRLVGGINGRHYLYANYRTASTLSTGTYYVVAGTWLNKKGIAKPANANFKYWTSCYTKYWAFSVR